MLTQLIDVSSPKITFPFTAPVFEAVSVNALVLTFIFPTVAPTPILVPVIVIPCMTPFTLPSFANVIVFVPLAPVAVVEITFKALGGIICVNAPALSLENAFALNPADLNAVLPKLELELVIDISPPLNAVK